MQGRTVLIALALGVGLTACSGQKESAQEAAEPAGEAAATAEVQPAGKVVELAVDGMTCTGCESAVETTLTKLDGVQKAEASYEAKSATVVIDSTKIDESALIQALESMGYTARKKS